MTTHQEHLEQLEAKGEEVRQLQDAAIDAELQQRKSKRCPLCQRILP
jgi:hypothetical protein